MSALRTAWWKWCLAGVWLMIGIWFTWNLSEKAAELRAEGLKPPAQFVQFIPLIILSAPLLGLRRLGRWLPLVFVASMLLTALLIAPLHIGYGMIRATQIRTDPAQYQGVLTKYLHEVDLVAHFPTEIPKEVDDVRFSFQPRFFMGECISIFGIKRILLPWINGEIWQSNGEIRIVICAESLQAFHR